MGLPPSYRIFRIGDRGMRTGAIPVPCDYNYASSSWCLEELVKIMECRKGFGHTAYPVFYDVEPTEVRKQSGSVGDAFAKHKENEAARKWREALKEASDLAGWELKSIANGIDGNLIGMETRVNEVIASLEPGVGDVHMLGIWGMGGAGKTTLARAIFENIGGVLKASLKGLKKLHKLVLLDVLKDQSIKVNSVSSGKSMMQKMMRVRKVLVVLDEVDHKDQLDALAGDHNWFKPGSRIIIKTREEQALVAHRVSLIHNVTLLSQVEAGHIFSRCLEERIQVNETWNNEYTFPVTHYHISACTLKTRQEQAGPGRTEQLNRENRTWL
ncbi:Toll/interleukin-1 receptor domain-containing protein [Tanacetum coccineum]